MKKELYLFVDCNTDSQCVVSAYNLDHAYAVADIAMGGDLEWLGDITKEEALEEGIPMFECDDLMNYYEWKKEEEEK